MARKIDPRQQFSKKLAGRAEWFWFGYLVLLAVLMAIQPDAALPAVYLGIMVTGVMIISVLAYTTNSINEKSFYWLARIAEAASGVKKRSADESYDEEDSSAEEESNG